jgi:membrane protease YdiL (CAAX protease family)
MTKNITDMSEEINIILTLYIGIMIISIFPFLFYFKKENLYISFIGRTKDYTAYVIFIIIIDFVFTIYGLKNIENIDFSDKNLLIFALLNSLIFAPIVEEIVFRSHPVAFIEKYKINKNYVFLITIITSALWSFGHYDINFGFFISTFVFGVLLFKIRLESNSITLCMLLHSTSNAIGIAALLLR